MKYSIAALVAAGRYSSRAVLICTSVFLASSTCSAMVAAVRLVVSRLSTRAVSLRMLPSAEDRRWRRESSSSFSLILKSFCCFVKTDCKRGRGERREGGGGEGDRRGEERMREERGGEERVGEERGGEERGERGEERRRDGEERGGEEER